MLKMSRHFSVFGANCPAISADKHLESSKIEHGFNRQNHARLKYRTFAECYIIGDLRRFMELCSAAMTDKIPDYRNRILPGNRFNRC